MGLRSGFAIALSLFCLFAGELSPQIAYGQNLKNARKETPLLSCKEVGTRIESMLDLHYQYSEFTNELSTRLMEKVFESFDPYRVFFIQPDIEDFSNIKASLAKKIFSNDCKFIFDIHKLLIQRIQERIEFAKIIIKRPLSFAKPEYISLENKMWGESISEANEKFRKKIKTMYLSLKTDEDEPSLIKSKIIKNFQQLHKNYTSYTSDKIYSVLLNSFALALDPHSAHMLPEDHNSFLIHISNKLEGIGIKLQEKDGFVIVRSMMEGGVAQKDGRLKLNDKIIAVDPGDGSGFQDIVEMNIQDAVNLIRGTKGSIVKLIVLRKGELRNERFNISLKRDEIDIKDEEVKSTIIESDNKKIGIIKISTFYTDLKCKSRIFIPCHGVSYDVKQKLKKLTQKGIDGLLIDLRNNGGGDFPESINLTGLFIPRGTAVQTVDRNMVVRRQLINESNWIYRGPLVVLINKYSASASEIFAGAIQDYARGIIVGDESTYGKATVQIVQEIPGTFGRKIDGALKVTQSKFYRPSGLSNQKIGVKPNIHLPSILEIYDIGESKLDYSLENDTIPPAINFKPLQNLLPLIAKIQNLSNERIAKNLKYQEIIKKITRFKKEKSNKILLTNEFAKFLEDQNSPNEYKEKDNEAFANIHNKQDLQIQESILITIDSIKLTENRSFWVGMGN